jgi:sulfite reductase (ferredoxin)
MFQFFLRNICQEMGRKFKMSFSSDKDTALSYLHDLGFIPKNGEAWIQSNVRRIGFSATSC